MGKHTGIKRLSTASASSSKSIDVKARKRIEELFEVTDEIINAYNEINDKYVSEIFRKYQKLQDVNKKLKYKLNSHHCTGCKCILKSHENNEAESSTDDDDDDDEDDDDEDTDYSRTKVKSPKPTANSIRTRFRKSNPFIISDIEDTQNFDANDSRFHKNPSGDDEDETTMETHRNSRSATKSSDELGEEIDENNDEDDEDNTMDGLPIALQNVIQRKASKNKNAKSYLLKIPLYPALCEYLVDKSRTSFDHRPSEAQVRPLIANHISQQLANDSKMRMRIRDELREIHRSYMRTFMRDPHSIGVKSANQNNKQLNVKISPM